MDSTHAFEPSFQRISSGQCRISEKNIPKAAARMFFGLLERLCLCRTPRIVGAYCLDEEPDRPRNEV